MNYKIVFYILLIAFLVFIPIDEVESNAFLLEQNDLKELDKEDLVFTGTIKDLRYHIWSRDNFYTFKIQDLESDKYIDVKIYTIKWFKRVNFFECEDEDEIRLKHLFHFQPKQNKLGYFNISREAISLDCIEHISEEEIDEVLKWKNQHHSTQ